MTRSLVVGVDGSVHSLRAVRWAVDEAAARGADLRLLYVVSPEAEDGYAGGNSDLPLSRVIANHVVAEAAVYARARRGGVHVVTEVLHGPVAATLLDESRSAEVLVLGSRGRGGFTGLLLGSVSLRAAAHARVPVVVVRGRERDTRGRRPRIVVGVSGDDASEAAVDFALREATLRNAEVMAVHAWRRSRVPAAAAGGLPSAAEPADEQFAERVLDFALSATLTDRLDVPVERRAAEGSARTALLHASAHADLVVIGARRRDGHLGRHLRTTGQALLHHAACPVAIVPTP